MSGTKPTNIIARDFRGSRLYLQSIHHGKGMRWHADIKQAMSFEMTEALTVCDRASRDWGAKCAVLDAQDNLITQVVSGRVTGTNTYFHECPDWDFMPIDKSCSELVGCSCFNDPEFLAIREAHAQALDKFNEEQQS
jgi:hypothetical protein